MSDDSSLGREGYTEEKQGIKLLKIQPDQATDVSREPLCNQHCLEFNG